MKDDGCVKPMNASIDCLPGVFVFRFPIDEGMEAVGEIYKSIRDTLGDNGNVIGIPNFSSLEYLTREELLEVREVIDKCIDGSE